MNEDFNPEDQKFSLTREIYDWIESGLTAVVCVILVFTFVARMVGVDGESMLPTLNDRDRVVASSAFYTPRRGDIVVITKPNDRHEPLVKRIIATGGQTVDIDFAEGVVTVDGQPLGEPYINEPTWEQGDMQFPQTVPQGYVFVMGDNRNHSWDSRFTAVGMVDQRYILGKIVYRLMPYDQMGRPQ